MAIITLTSDYGLKDHYLAALKGALLQEVEDLRLVDISHLLEPGNLYDAAFILRNAYHAFPKSTVHLVAFNELSANQRVLAAEMDGHFFILSDCGLLGLINPEVKINRVVEVDLRTDSSLFPARDIMSRAATHLARGGKMQLLGRETSQYEQKTIMRPKVNAAENSIVGSVVYIDNFGNLITNISHKTFREVGRDRGFVIELPRSQRIMSLSENYNQNTEGKTLALFNSQNLLEVAVSGARGKDYNGANTLLGMEVRNPVTINFYDNKSGEDDLFRGEG